MFRFVAHVRPIEGDYRDAVTVRSSAYYSWIQAYREFIRFRRMLAPHSRTGMALERYQQGSGWLVAN